MKKPSKSILDRTFRYVPSHATDIRERFKRIREEQGQGNKDKVVPLTANVKRRTGHGS